MLPKCDKILASWNYMASFDRHSGFLAGQTFCHGLRSLMMVFGIRPQFAAAMAPMNRAERSGEKHLTHGSTGSP
jgi:hypothetical protein